MPFVADDVVTGLQGGAKIRLEAPALGALMGWESPVAIGSPDGNSLLYNSWVDLMDVDPEQSFSQQGIETGDPLGRPSLRVLDMNDGSDELLEDGAFSGAWHADGSVAYFKGTDPDFRANTPYEGQIVVRETLDAPGVPWTAPGEYLALAWAGDSLLVYQQGDGGYADLLALDAPGAARLLARTVTLVAVSPDGSEVLLERHLAGPAVASIVSVATGETRATLDLGSTDPATGAELTYFGSGGDWQGDTVVAESGAGIALLDTSGDLVLRDVLSFARSNFPMPVHEPRFLDGTEERVVAWAPVPGKGRAVDRVYVYLSCDVAANRCVQGRPFTSRAFFAAYNPSRPN